MIHIMAILLTLSFADVRVKEKPCAEFVAPERIEFAIKTLDDASKTELIELLRAQSPILQQFDKPIRLTLKWTEDAPEISISEPLDALTLAGLKGELWLNPFNRGILEALAKKMNRPIWQIAINAPEADAAPAPVAAETKPPESSTWRARRPVQAPGVNRSYVIYGQPNGVCDISRIGLYFPCYANRAGGRRY